MSIKKDLKEIKEAFLGLTESTLKKAKKYDEIHENLKNVVLKPTNFHTKIDENGNLYFSVEFKTPEIRVYYDENGEMIKNNMFYSINYLNLISIDDMLELNKKLGYILTMNRKGKQ